MMRDLRHLGNGKNRRVAPNRARIKKEPLDLRRYILPLLRYGSIAIVLLLTGGLLTASVHAMMQSTPLPLKRMEVHGTKRLTADEIIALSGLSVGQNMLKLHLKNIGQQVSANPWVASVKVQRFYPGTISISITERNPVAIINMGLLYYLDERGEPFKPLTPGDRLDYPVITGFEEEELAGEMPDGRAALKQACSLLAAIQQHGGFILTDLSEINYARGNGFTIYTAAASLPIRIGNDQFSDKLKRLEKIHQELTRQAPAIRAIDLDYNDRIVVKKG